MQSTRPNYSPPLSQAIRHIVKKRLSDHWHLNSDSLPNNPNKETDQQRQLRIEMVDYCLEIVQENLPEVYRDLYEQTEYGRGFTRGCRLYQTVTSMFYREWRIQRKRYLSSNKTTVPRSRLEPQNKEEKVASEYFPEARTTGNSQRSKDEKSGPQDEEEMRVEGKDRESTNKNPRWDLQLKEARWDLELKEASDNNNLDKEGLIDSPSAILDHMLRKTVERYPDRYGECLTTENLATVKAFLMSTVKKEVWNVFTRRSFNLDSLRAIGGDLSKPGIGIYLHLIWKRNNSIRHQRYIGQSTNWFVRVTNHRNPQNWTKYPCLHYHFLNQDKMRDDFVILAEISLIEIDVRNLQLFLNLLEMWFCLLFQTLQKPDLEEYLPPTSPPTRVGLNVALPLWQSTKMDSTSFRALLSPESETRGYTEWAIQNFRALRNYNDPRLLNYFLACCARSGQARRRNTRNAIENGVECRISAGIHSKSVKSWRQNFSACNILFNIPSSLVKLVHKSVIFVKFDIIDEGEHPHRFAGKLARASDPVIRLGVLIKGEDENGQEFCSWLKHGDQGECIIKRLNACIDEIEGIPREEIEKRERRGVTNNLGNGRHEWVYT